MPSVKTSEPIFLELETPTVGTLVNFFNYSLNKILDSCPRAKQMYIPR